MNNHQGTSQEKPSEEPRIPRSALFDVFRCRSSQQPVVEEIADADTAPIEKADRRFEKEGSDSTSWRQKIWRKLLRPMVQPTRREFLRALGIGAVAVSPFVAPTILSDILTENQYDPEIHEQLDHLERRYGCEIQLGLKTPLGVIGELTLAQKKAALTLLKSEMAKYPPVYFDHCGYPIIVLGNYPHLPAGKMYPHGDDVYLAVNIENILEYGRSDSSEPVEATFHHELEHAADLADGRKVVAKKRGVSQGEIEPSYDLLDINNPDWRSLNTDPDPYLNNPLMSALIGIIKPYPVGFMRGYGTANPDEDQAVTSESIIGYAEGDFSDPGDDPVAQKKVTEMKAKIYRRSGGLMDEQYWKDLKDGIVNEDYWDKRITA
ncbi:hypothetical protein COY07_04315 [Candidatus Peregrinibacteria bacterium CG_4_10_14_0_2_um_filter_43_11]|nr:MAG: hypothetical protein COY07_04315 [Candidatus Peregrinibacteria bacterium CG_4_10_14_0_2_um_filter_43_11]